jgi:hypothetical protein
LSEKIETVMENVRGMFIGLSASSLFIPIVGLEIIFLLFGVGSGVYYGFKIEKDLSSTSLGLHRNEFSYLPEA